MKVRVVAEIEVDEAEWSEWRRITKPTKARVKGDVRQYVYDRLHGQLNKLRRTGTTVDVTVVGAVSGLANSYPKGGQRDWYVPPPAIRPTEDEVAWVFPALTTVERQAIEDHIPAAWGVPDVLTGISLRAMQMPNLCRRAWDEYGEQAAAELGGVERSQVDAVVTTLNLIHGRLPTEGETRNLLLRVVERAS